MIIKASFDYVIILDDEASNTETKPEEFCEIELAGTPTSAAVKSEFGSPKKCNRWNQCTYQCAVCLKTSNSRGSITTHIVEEHGMSFRQYRDKYDDLEVSLTPNCVMYVLYYC